MRLSHYSLAQRVIQRCSQGSRPLCERISWGIIRDEANKLNQAISEVTGRTGMSGENIEREAEDVSNIVKRDNIPELIKIIITSYEIILDCAREDIGTMNIKIT